MTVFADADAKLAELEERIAALENVTPPPPPRVRLRWRPPATPGNIVNITQPGTYTFPSGQDVLIKPNVTSSTGGRIELRGGRHRVIIGGHAKLTGGTDPIGILVEAGDEGGETHIEGMYFETVNALTFRTNQQVTIENCHAKVADAAAHADLMQSWKGQKSKGIRVHRFTGHSAFTFLSDLTDEPGVVFGTYTPAFWELYDVDLHGPQGLVNWMGSPAHCVWRGDNLWLETSFEASGQRRSLDDQLRQHGEQYAPKYAGVQILDAAGTLLFTGAQGGTPAQAPGDIGKLPGHWLRYHQNPRLTMTWKWGVPPDGEFVPAATVGVNYVSPGYL